MRSRYENATPNLCWVFCAINSGAPRARVGGAPLLSKSFHPRKFGNHVTVHRPTDRRPSAPQENQCLLSHCFFQSKHCISKLPILSCPPGGTLIRKGRGYFLYSLHVKAPPKTWWVLKFDMGRQLCPSVQPLTLLYTTFPQKRYLFRIPSIDKWYRFTYLFRTLHAF